MLRKIILSIGLSIVIGVAAGYTFSEEKYFYMWPAQSKKEVTYDRYKSNHRSDDDYIKQNVYNKTQALIIGLASFGGLLIISALYKQKAKD